MNTRHNRDRRGATALDADARREVVAPVETPPAPPPRDRAALCLEVLALHVAWTTTADPRAQQRLRAACTDLLDFHGAP